MSEVQITSAYEDRIEMNIGASVRTGAPTGSAGEARVYRFRCRRMRATSDSVTEASSSAGSHAAATSPG